MSKKNYKQKVAVKPAVAVEETKTTTIQSSSSSMKDWWKYVLLFSIVFAYYINTVNNKYALDDSIVIQQNEFVKEGFGGVYKILTNDAYASFYKIIGANNQLSGGRYRPLSIATFAVEYAFFGENPFISHLGNVLLYAISVLLLFYLLSGFMLKNNADAAFAVALLFAIHPIHTEVIANAKSRDEILSLFFLSLTFLTLFLYNEKKKSYFLFIALFTYFLALLSKEYALSMVFVIPVFAYVLLKRSWSKSIAITLPFMLVVGLYVLLRYKIVGFNKFDSTEILNSPYLYAKASQAFASKIEVLGRYVKLLVLPYPLSSDYSYNQIPYVNFASIGFLVSFVLYLGMFIGMFYYISKRHIFGFAIAFYLFTLFMVSNLVMDIGAPMGERLAYHASFGFCIVAGVSITNFAKRFANIPYLQWMIFVPLILIFGIITINRNPAWKNDLSLFSTDVKTVPNSALLRCSLGASQLSEAETNKDTIQKAKLIAEAIDNLNVSLKIHPTYVKCYLQLGVAYYLKNNFDTAKYFWDRAHELYPTNHSLKKYYKSLSTTYMNMGLSAGANKRVQEAEGLLKKAVSVDSLNAEIWYNLGGAHFEMKEYAKAKSDFGKALQLDPNHKEAKRGFDAIVIN